jgi:hypothetical protein
MDGEKLIEHLENLVPGIVTLACVAWRVPPTANVFANPMLQKLIEQQPFISGLTLVASAYLIGVLVFVASRLVLDTISSLTLRPILLKLYRWSEFGFNPRLINRKYRLALDSARRQSQSSSTRQEVARRRQRGRLVRTLLVPLFILLWPFRDVRQTLCIGSALLLVYSYSEVAIYQEAKLIITQKTTLS